MGDWTLPRINWQAPNAVTAEDFNRIEGNIQYLKENLDKISFGLPAKPASDAPSTWPPGMYYTPVYNNGYPVPYGTLLTIKGSTGNSVVQLLQEWPGTDGGPSSLWIRAKRDVGEDVWGPWQCAYSTAIMLGYDLPGTYQYSNWGGAYWPTSPTRFIYAADALPKKVGCRQVVTKVALSLAILPSSNDTLYAYVRIKRPDGSWWQSPTHSVRYYYDVNTGTGVWESKTFLDDTGGITFYNTTVEMEVYAWSNYNDNKGTVGCTAYYDAYLG